MIIWAISSRSYYWKFTDLFGRRKRYYKALRPATHRARHVTCRGDARPSGEHKLFQRLQCFVITVDHFFDVRDVNILQPVYRDSQVRRSEIRAQREEVSLDGLEFCVDVTVQFRRAS